MDKLSPEEEFQKHIAPRIEELSDTHVGKTETPPEIFAKKIGGPVAHKVIADAHDAKPVLHSDREW